MIHRKPLIVLAVLAALSAAGMALAADPAPAKTPTQDGASAGFLARLDKNGDGVIDRSEAAADPRLAEKFDQLDKNHDGKLEKDELPHPRWHRRGGAAGPGGHGPLARLDTDKDGRISKAEAQADPRFAARFDKLDVNKDGYVDKVDFQARFQQARDAWFAKADTNHDGMLSKAEFDAAKGPFGAHPRPPMHPGKPGPGKAAPAPAPTGTN